MKKSHKDADWAEAKRRCRLSADDIVMAKALGFQPKSLMKNVPSNSQQWKMPVREWVRSLYEKKFGKVLASVPAGATRTSAQSAPAEEDFWQGITDDDVPF